MEVKSTRSYFDCAEEDYKYLKEDFRQGRVANYMGSMSQNTCERYLKHLIEEKDSPQTDYELEEKAEILKSHNLKKLMKYLKQHDIASFTKDEWYRVASIDGFYFTTRYPGDDAQVLDKDDIQDCMAALDVCRTKTLELSKEQVMQNNRPNNELSLDTAIKDVTERSAALKNNQSSHDSPSKSEKTTYESR